MRELHVNHEFLLSFAEEYEGNILDYGCGAGETVNAGLARGLPIWGYDTYSAGHSRRRNMLDEGLLTSARVRYSMDGRIPFDDAFFSIVISNQVFEHVHDIDRALSEISRVLKPGGLIAALFPTREVLREGHIGIPMSHWWPAGSRSRFLWVRTGRILGLGYHKGGKSLTQWTTDSVDYLDNWTVYRSFHQIKTRTAIHFKLTNAEPSYIRFRLRNTRLAFLVPTTRWPIVDRLQVWALHALMGRVLILFKEA